MSKKTSKKKAAVTPSKKTSKKKVKCIAAEVGHRSCPCGGEYCPKARQ